MISLVFMLTWLFTFIWWVVLKLCHPYISPFCRLRCDLRSATTILMSAKPAGEDIRVEADETAFVMRAVRWIEKCKVKIWGPRMIVESCPVKQEEVSAWETCRYFDFQCKRYCWTEKLQQFGIQHIDVGSSQATLIAQSKVGLTTKESISSRLISGLNRIDVNLNPFVIDLLSEFFDYYYLYQFFVMWVWCSFYCYITALAIFVVIIIAGVIRVFVKRKAQFEVKRTAEVETFVHVMRDGSWKVVSSRWLVPGDVIAVEAQKPVCCDCVLVRHRCVVDESSLTGEPTPVPKIPLSGDRPYNKHSSSDMKFTLFAGTLIQSVSCGGVMEQDGGGGGRAHAVVLNTGSQTEQGELMRGILYPATVSIKFEEHWKLVFVMLILYGLALYLIVAGMFDFEPVSFYYGIFTIAHVLSPLVPAVLVAVQAKVSSRLKDREIFCVNLERTFVAGKAKVFCFDKTGTLTKAGLEYYGVERFSSADDSGDSILDMAMENLLGSCHELDLTPGAPAEGSSRAETESDEEGRWWPRRWLRCGMGIWWKRPRFLNIQNLDENSPEACSKKGSLTVTEATREWSVVGNQVDKQMFDSSGFAIVGLKEAVPVVKHIATGRVLHILKRLEFDRGTMTMSVIVEDPAIGEKWVYSKGSYESIAALAEEVPSNYVEVSRDFAKKGYYVLGISCKRYQGPENCEVPRREVEGSTRILGLLLFRNDLKSDSCDTISNLREGGIRPVMITGDSALTGHAIGIAAAVVKAPTVLLCDASTTGSKEEVVWRNIATEEVTTLSTTDLKSGTTELAVTGSAFNALVKLPCPEELNDLADKDCTFMSSILPYTSIFARMNPAQKTEAVKLFMKTAVTGMCGDGANDAGALRAAHCGIALGSTSTQATIVAPFSTSRDSITTVVTLVSEGRNALAMATAGYKRMLLVGQSIIGIKIAAYVFRALPSQSFFITVDCITNIAMSIAMLQSRPAKKLSASRPTAKLLGTETVLSLTFQIITNWIFVIVVVAVLFQQDWFRCKEFDHATADPARWWTMCDNYETATLTLLGLFQVINATAIFNFGFDYRVQWVRNYWPVGVWSVFIIFASTLALYGPSWLSCVYRLNCGDQSLMRYWTSDMEEPRLSYFGGDIGAPPGCPCSDQIGVSETCENEYIECDVSKYNQVYHHNIMPMSYRGILIGIIALNCILGIFFEGFFMNGPIRRLLRRRRQKRRERIAQSRDFDGAVSEEKR
eukprot:GHVS01074036.1.p1 GENE.GHVS01074036.1~~GHVS01074036.1.p1  ORF type:complete len:1223 (-),score=107.80 GHVS01074036.1:142-3810(-)